MTAPVRLDEVVKRFGSHVAVDQLDLEVPEGSIYGFIGPNGSGKTTTIRLILRILQPDAGRVTVFGQDRGKVADDRIGYLPEERGLYKKMKVVDALTYFAKLKGKFNCQKEIDGWLERLGAADWKHKKIEALSKGMAQKVQFIAAVVARPRLAILDEPFAGLDPVNLQILKDAVLDLRNDGVTIIFSTHDMIVAEQMCDYVFMIFQGRKVLDGTLDAIRRRYPVRSVKLRLASGEMLPADIRTGESVAEDNGSYRVQCEDEQAAVALLRRLAQQVDIEYFEVGRPTLNDIFVDIAKPKDFQSDDRTAQNADSRPA